MKTDCPLMEYNYAWAWMAEEEAHQPGPKLTVPVWIQGKEILRLVDSACSQMVMEAALADEMITTERMVDLQCIHVNVKPYASRLTKLTVRIHTDLITAVLASKLAHPVIIG